MQYCRSFSLVLLATMAITGIRVNAQAHVVENQTTYIYVDATNGSDKNSGTVSSPFQTVQAAINKANTFNRASVGTKVIINPGIYREYVNLGSYNVTSAPLTVEAASSGTAIIAASDVLTGWTQESANIYSTSWTADLGTCPIPSGWPTNFAPIASRSEMVFVDGDPLTQTMSYAELVPGTFFVDESTNMMFVSPGSSTNMETAVVEAAKRTQTLSVSSRTNVVLRGLVFRHAANCMNSTSVAINGSNNVLIDAVQALWNNWGGFGVFNSSNVTVQKSVASYNGGIGFSATKDQSTLFNFDESDYNNWRGAQAAYYDWAMGGTKLFQMRSTTVQNHSSYNNQAQGLWFDTDNKDILIDNATLSGNVQAALQIERNEGPVTLQNSHLCFSGQGVNVLTSSDVTVRNNTFYNNSGTNKYQADIYIAGQTGGKIITDWQTGQSYDLFTTGMVLSGNTFQDSSIGQLAFGTYLGGSDWTSFWTTLKASNNTWYNPATTNAFKIPNGKTVNLAGWQSAISSDFSSTWAPAVTSPLAACLAPNPSLTDFSLSVDNRAYTIASGKAVANVNLKSFGNGPVNLRVSGVPSGVGATLSQQNLVSGSVTLTFVSSLSAVAQNVPITIWATGGSRVHSVTFYLQVSPFAATQTTPTITWPTPAGIIYGTPLSSTQLGATLNVAGACSYLPPAGTVLAPGTQTLTANCSPADTVAYKTPAAAKVSLAVSKAPLTITASSPTVGFGDALPVITPSYSGFVNGDSSASLSTAPICTTSYTLTSAVGSSPATNCSGAVSTNYLISNLPGAVTITKALQTINFTQPPTTVSYGASAIPLAATSTSGLPVTFSGTAGVCLVSGINLNIIGAGKCSVTASQTGNTNYSPAPTLSRTVNANPAALIITASSPTVTYGDAVPTITAGYSGLVNGDTTASLTTTPTCTTAYTRTSAVGASPATSCSGAIDPDYSIHYVAGAVTIIQAAQTITAKPVFSLASGTYTSVQSVTISDATNGVTIYYTVDGKTPTTSSTIYTQAIKVGTTTTLKAIAQANGSAVSATATADFTIKLSQINFIDGFSGAGNLQLNGKTTVIGSTLELTDGKTNEASSAFFATPVSVAKFSTSFTILQTSASGDGMMFVIQNAAAGAQALGPAGSSLGYSYGATQPGAILNSLGVKFDIYSNVGEGVNSTGLYLNGARPTTPALDMTASGVDLHRGHPMAAQLTYDGTTLKMTITDTVSAKSFSASWAVNISQAIGSSTAYVGFTASTGGSSAVQQVLNWTF
jgi:Legume lectin domain/Chitobiase/beta-hexosaminidase C-terminal domain/MBG domain (YGX type)/Right handed beta helix region